MAQRAHARLSLLHDRAPWDWVSPRLDEYLLGLECKLGLSPHTYAVRKSSRGLAEGTCSRKRKSGHTRDRRVAVESGERRPRDIVRGWSLGQRSAGPCIRDVTRCHFPVHRRRVSDEGA